MKCQRIKAWVNTSFSWLKASFMPEVSKVSSPIALRFNAHVEFWDFAFFDFLDANAILLLSFLPSAISSFILLTILPN